MPAGDSAWLIELPDRLDAAVNARAIEIAARIRGAQLGSVTDVVVGYRSVMVYVRPLVEAEQPVGPALQQILSTAASPDLVAGPVVTVPVCYGGDLGPDLSAVAAFAALTPEEVVDRHAAREYRVFMVGFVPGFAYMAEVDATIAAPRRPTPRVRVPPGSVAIANAQTGIYPSATPGGWNIIGRTPLRPYDPGRSEPFLFRAGDRVRFRPIALADYAASSEWGDI